MFAAEEQTVRDVISAFNDRVRGVGPKGHRESMPKIGPVVREEICRTAKSDPARLGCPFTCWSLARLRDYLAEHKHVRLSREAIRQVLNEARRTGSWSYTTNRHSWTDDLC